MAVWTCGYFGPRGHCVVRGVRANQPRPWDAERLRRYAVDANASSPPETPKNLCVTMWRLTLALHSTCFVFKASCSNGDFLIYWFKVFFAFASVWHHDINRQCAPVWVGYLSYCVNIQKKTQSQSVHTESKLMTQELHPREHVLLWLDEATFFTRSRGRPFGPVLWGQFDLSRTLCSVPGVSISIFVLSSVDVDNSGLLT